MQLEVDLFLLVSCSDRRRPFASAARCAKPGRPGPGTGSIRAAPACSVPRCCCVFAILLRHFGARIENISANKPHMPGQGATSSCHLQSMSPRGKTVVNHEPGRWRSCPRQGREQAIERGENAAQ